MKLIPCPKCEGKGRITDPVFVASEMKKKREKMNVPMRTVAARMGVSTMYLCDMEAGRRHFTPEMQTIFKVALEDIAKDKTTKGK